MSWNCARTQTPTALLGISIEGKDSLDFFERERHRLNQSIYRKQRNLNYSQADLNDSLSQIYNDQDRLLVTLERIFLASITRLDGVLNRVNIGEESSDLTRSIQNQKTNKFLDSLYRESEDKAQMVRSRTPNAKGRALVTATEASISALYAKAVLKQSEILYKAHPRQLVFNEFDALNSAPSDNPIPVPLSDNKEEEFNKLKQELQDLAKGRENALNVIDENLQRINQQAANPDNTLPTDFDEPSISIRLIGEEERVSDQSTITNSVQEILDTIQSEFNSQTNTHLNIEDMRREADHITAVTGSRLTLANKIKSQATQRAEYIELRLSQRDIRQVAVENAV